MMDMKQLARNILALEDEHRLSKVRFAKTIYFVHKELIRNSIMKKDSFKYIRMPLGPVPAGFMEITSLCPDITSEKEKTGLAYATERFTTTAQFEGTSEEKQVISESLNFLRNYPTSTLVEVSHQDPSWINHKNSEQYFISEDDMSNNLTLFKQYSTNFDDEKDRMQASLVRGMMDDIVSESTKLEYPA